MPLDHATALHVGGRATGAGRVRPGTRAGPSAAPEVQSRLKFWLAGIGMHFPRHRKRANAFGGKLGIFRGYPASKGCTAPFAPLWIAEIGAAASLITEDSRT